MDLHVYRIVHSMLVVSPSWTPSFLRMSALMASRYEPSFDGKREVFQLVLPIRAAIFIELNPRFLAFGSALRAFDSLSGT